MTTLTIYDQFHRTFPRRWLWGDVMKPLGMSDYTGEEITLTPRVDLVENDDLYCIMADFPGYTDKDVGLEVVDGWLKLTAEIKTETETENGEYHLRERRTGHYARSFKLPDNVDPEGITAKMENGTLRVTVPKREETKPKKIDINVH